MWVSFVPDGVGHPLRVGHLRTWWFGAVSDTELSRFSSAIVADAELRARIAAGGEPWQLRDRVFFRSLLWHITETGHGEHLDEDAAALLALVEGHLEDLAAADADVRAREVPGVVGELDVGIRAGVEALGGAGFSTRTSCQSALGAVEVDGAWLVLGAAHEPCAYVGFAELVDVDAGAASDCGLVLHRGGWPGRLWVPHPRENHTAAERFTALAARR